MVQPRMLWLSLTAIVLMAQAPPGWVTVRAAQQPFQLSGFAAVQPATPVTVTSVQTGTLTALTVEPGEMVQKDQPIGRLGGPQIAAALVQAQGADQAAKAVLASELGKFADHLSTKALVAQARASHDAAQATLIALQAATLLKSPVSGQVQSVSAGPGAALLPGQPVAVVQPASGAWVEAVLYDPAAATLPPGQTAQFIPANGQSAQTVILRGLLNTQADGGRVLAFAGEALQPGEAGTLTLALPPRRVLLVPSEALVLDDGRWWVMVHDAKGDHAAQVVPGEGSGTETPILSGISAGQQIVVKDAALLYHRGIAALYQPPD